MANIMQIMPSLEGDEMTFVQGLIKDLNDNQAMQFANVYNSRRKDPQTILLTSLLGFIGIAGIQRFILGQIGMGLLYLFTVGFCWIGTIIDLVSHKKLTFEYNSTVAQQVAVMVRGSN
jgi:TM2 domain-containing membrane protein YozV